jgi:hypothetical protein
VEYGAPPSGVLRCGYGEAPWPVLKARTQPVQAYGAVRWRAVVVRRRTEPGLFSAPRTPGWCRTGIERGVRCVPLLLRDRPYPKRRRISARKKTYANCSTLSGPLPCGSETAKHCALSHYEAGREWAFLMHPRQFRARIFYLLASLAQR